MMTADQARTLTQEAKKEQNCQTEVDLLLSTLFEQVKLSASLGNSKFITRSYGFGSMDPYKPEESHPLLNRLVITRLRELGFKCSIETQDSQFVDIWLEISW